jgi:hypothetical protein
MYGWAGANMDYESSLGFADHIGFRCGTCHEYTAFDPVQRRKIPVRVRPLIAMEQTVLSEKYMALGAGSEAFDRLDGLKRQCKQVDGNFTLLWHNTLLISGEERELFESLL